MKTFGEIKARQKDRGAKERAERQRMRKWEAERLAEIRAAGIPPYLGKEGDSLGWVLNLLVPSVREWRDDVGWELEPAGAFINLLCDHCRTQLVRGRALGFGDGLQVGCPGCGWSDTLAPDDEWREARPPVGWTPKDEAP